MWWTAVFLPVWTVSILPNNATPFEKVLDGIDGDIVARAFIDWGVTVGRNESA
jgi:hypothetical protein